MTPNALNSQLFDCSVEWYCTICEAKAVKSSNSPELRHCIETIRQLYVLIHYHFENIQYQILRLKLCMWTLKKKKTRLLRLIVMNKANNFIKKKKTENSLHHILSSIKFRNFKVLYNWEDRIKVWYSRTSIRLIYWAPSQYGIIGQW